MMEAQMSSPGTGAGDKMTLSSPRVISFSSKHMASIADKYLNIKKVKARGENSFVCKALDIVANKGNMQDIGWRSDRGWQ